MVAAEMSGQLGEHSPLWDYDEAIKTHSLADGNLVGYSAFKSYTSMDHIG